MSLSVKTQGGSGGGEGFFGIGEVREYEGGSAVKIVKFL